MNNKYLTKIAETDRISDKLRDPDYMRAGAKAGFYSTVGAGLGHAASMAVRAKPGSVINGLLVGTGAGLGLSSGIKSSLKSQTREQQVHDIKTQGAEQRNEMHNLKIKALQKHAQEYVGHNQAKKDAINLGVIATLGGLGNYAAHKMLPTATKFLPKIGTGAMVAGLGTGISLAADYVGIKANHAINKRIDKK